MNALAKRVLVVDDDPVVGRSFDRVLSEKGYAVSTALDGEEALNRLGKEDYDVVFTDIKMPGMDGIEVANRIRKRRPWIPVVIITGYGTPENEAKAAAAGVSAFVRKPLSAALIEDSTRRALQVIEGGKGKAVAEETAASTPESAAVVTAPLPAAEPEVPAEGVVHSLKSVALLIAAPVIGLAFVIAAPFIGLGALAWIGGKALMKHEGSRKAALFVRNVTLFLAAPFVGLAYAIALPFIGLGAILWMGAKALMKRAVPE